MCARYSLIGTAEELVEWFKLRKDLMLAPRYNIAPTQPVLCVLAPESGSLRRDALMHWGLIPSWAKDRTMAARMINARSETAAGKPSFRTALRRRRCLIPASGYYEWQSEGKRKQPYWIRVKNAPLFSFAGLWETWQAPDGGELDSCTLLTRDAIPSVRMIHDRMPVILFHEQYDAWLDPKQQDGRAALEMLRAPEDRELYATAVNPYVGNSRHEGPQCIAPPDSPPSPA